MELNRIIAHLRNPWGMDEKENRTARVEAAQILEDLSKLYSNEGFRDLVVQAEYIRVILCQSRSPKTT